MSGGGREGRGGGADDREASTLMIVYCDRHILRHIQNADGILPGDRDKLREVIRDGKVSVPLSVTGLEETLAQALDDRVGALLDLRWTINFAGAMRLVKPSGDLLNEYIRAYAEDRAADPYSTVDISWMEGASPAQMPALTKVVQEARLNREEFVITNAKVRDLITRPGISRDARRAFPEYYRAFAENCVEGFARRAGVLPECQRRGLRGLLGIKVVQVAVGITLSFLYAQTFERQGARRQDIGDIHHTVAAGLADVFVTNDRRLTRLIQRIPGLLLEVCTLGQLPARLGL